MGAPTLTVIGIMVSGFSVVIGVMLSAVGRLDTKIDKLGIDLHTEIGRLDTKIDKLNTDLRSEISQVRTELGGRIDKLDTKVDAQSARIDQLTKQVEEHLRTHASA